jgi:hypothetical protein
MPKMVSVLFSVDGWSAPALPSWACRVPRPVADGSLYHALQRGNNRSAVFATAADFQTFLLALAHTQFRCPFRLYGYYLMTNYFHLLLAPSRASPSGETKVPGTRFTLAASLRGAAGDNLLRRITAVAYSRTPRRPARTGHRARAVPPAPPLPLPPQTAGTALSFRYDFGGRCLQVTDLTPSSAATGPNG